MKQRLLITGLLFIVVITALTAQPLPQYNARQRGQIESLREQFQRRYDDNYRRALERARQLGRSRSVTTRDGRVMTLDGVDELGNLVYVGPISTTRAGNTTRTSSLYAGGVLGLSLSGGSATVRDRLGMWEAQGIPRSTHVELAGRINQVDRGGPTYADNNTHATHVAGILMAQGRNPQVRGMAYGANLQAYTSVNDATEMTAASPNLLLSNHSYGVGAGWQYNSSRTTTVKYEWLGDTTLSATDDYRFGYYNTDAQAWDRIAVNAPNYLIVVAASNDHDPDRPAPGEPYYLPNNGNVLSRQPRNTQTSYDQIHTRGTAKNALTVAAVSAILNGYNQPTDVRLASFSSWGPTDDGRIKPDLSGVGVSVLSGINDSDSSYAALQGTSMASPNVCGSLLLLQEYYAQLNPGRFMRSSTLRGLALHTADEAGASPGPDYRFGWGLLNTERAARVMGNASRTNVLDERTLAQGATYSLSIVASGQGPLVATICWTDPEGNVVTPTAGNVNDRTPKLINDLDIRISDGRTTIQPWVLDPANPAAAATRGDNVLDNVEQVLIANPVPGQSYTLTVSHKNALRNERQDYALLVSGAGGTAYCLSAATNNADTKISRVQFGSINQAGADGCTTYSDFTNATTTVQAGQSIPLTVSLGTCGAVRNAVVKAFIDYNQNGSFDDAGETVALSGVLTNSGQFTTNLVIAPTVQNTQFLRLRIVATETEDPATVRACGSYGNGETQDYVLRVVLTTNDVGTAALVSPDVNFCGSTNRETPVTVRVRNFGSAEQRNVPVTIRVADANNVDVTTLTGTIPVLAAFSESLLTLRTPATVTLTPGQSYRFTVTTGLTTDQNSTNNTLTEVRTTAAAPTNGLFSVIRCGSDTAFSLRNTGGGTAFWYDAPAGGNLLAAGNQTAARTLPASGQFYAVLNDFSGTIGPADKRAFGGGSYGGGFQPAPLVSAQVPLLIESARLYIGSPGQLTFTVRRLDNTAVSSVTLDVTPTRNQSVTTTTGGTYPDDPNDSGAEYALNLRIPAAGEYKITIEYAGSASIFRSNTAVTGFPYRLTTATGQPVMTIKGSLFTSNGTTDTLRTAWYYFYNLKVRSLDCPGPQRVAVTPAGGTAPTASVTASGSTSVCQGGNVTLQAATGPNYTFQWFRNGQAITGAISSTLQAATAGTYSVQVANGCLPVLSAAVPVTTLTAQAPTVTADGLILSSNAIGTIQWLLDGVPISSATTPTFAAVRTGRYSVRGSTNGCGEAISNEVYLTILAAEPEPTSDELLVYPNPVSRQLTVTVSTAPLGKTPPVVRLTDLRGLTLRTATLQRDGKTYTTQMDVTDLPAGTYFVAEQDSQGQTIRVRRITKQ